MLGPAAYGNLEFTLALMTFFALSVDLGLSTYGAREIAKQRSRAAILLRDISLLRALLALACFTVVVLLALLMEKDVEVKVLLILYGVSLLGIPGLLHWFFQGHDLMHWVAVAQIIRQGVFAALVLPFLTETTPLFYIGLFECASVSAVVLFCVWIVRRNPAWRLPALQFDWPALLKHLREAAPIGLCDMAWAMLWYFSTVLLGFMVTDQQLGWFGAAHRASGAVQTFVWLYFFNLLPSISRCVGQPRESLLRLMERSQTAVAWGGLFVALLLSVLSRPALMLAYGAAYENAAAPFSVLVWAVPVALISGHYRYALVAYNLQKWLLYWTALSALAGALAGPPVDQPIRTAGRRRSGIGSQCDRARSMLRNGPPTYYQDSVRGAAGPAATGLDRLAFPALGALGGQSLAAGCADRGHLLGIICLVRTRQAPRTAAKPGGPRNVAAKRPITPWRRAKRSN